MTINPRVETQGYSYFTLSGQKNFHSILSIINSTLLIIHSTFAFTNPKTMSSVIIEKLNNDEINKRGIKSWPIWTKEISEFDWFYDSDEECLILEGEVDVTTPEGVYTVKAGDFVTFKQGLKCVWKVKKPIRKHYNFL